MDSSSGKDNYFMPIQSMEKTCVKNYTEAEAEEYLRVKGLSFYHTYNFS